MTVATVLMIVGIAGIFVALLLSLTAIGVLTNEVRGVSKSLSMVDAYSSAPQALIDEVEPSFNDCVIAPLLDRFVNIGKKFTPADHSDRIRTRLEMAGNPPGWTVDRVTSMKVVGLMAFPGLALLIGVVLSLGFLPLLGLCAVAAVAGYLAPNMYLYQKGYDRMNQTQKALPDALDLLTISVESGLGFDAALSHVAKNTGGPLAEEFARVLQEMQIGLGRSQALRSLGDRTKMNDLRGFVSAMVQADAFGIPIAQVLRVQSREIRTRRRQRAEEAAQKVPVKIMVPLIFCILPCLFLAVLGPAIIGMMGAFSGTLN